MRRLRLSEDLKVSKEHIQKFSRKMWDTDMLRSDGTCWKLRKESQKSQMKTEVSRMSSGKGVECLLYNERSPWPWGTEWLWWGVVIGSKGHCPGRKRYMRCGGLAQVTVWDKSEWWGWERQEDGVCVAMGTQCPAREAPTTWHQLLWQDSASGGQGDQLWLEVQETKL